MASHAIRYWKSCQESRYLYQSIRSKHKNRWTTICDLYRGYLFNVLIRHDSRGALQTVSWKKHGDVTSQGGRAIRRRKAQARLERQNTTARQICGILRAVHWPAHRIQSIWDGHLAHMIIEKHRIKLTPGTLNQFTVRSTGKMKERGAGEGGKSQRFWKRRHEQMLLQKIIRPVETEWAASIVFAP